jgi:hypothetical protein
MMRRAFLTSCAVTLLCSALIGAQAKQENDGRARNGAATTAPITVVGCVAKQTDSSAHPVGSTTPGGGTVASTNVGAAPTGADAAGSSNRGASSDMLLIVTSTASVAPPASAVPGSSASATDTGTVPAAKSAGTSGSSRSTPTAYRLMFAAGQDASAYVGQRLEITGAVSERNTARSEGEIVARGGDSTRGTRSEVSSTAAAHPSSEIPTLTVQSFTVRAGRCDTATAPTP